MNGYALASVALVCLTACVLFALWRHYQVRDTRAAEELALKTSRAAAAALAYEREASAVASRLLEQLEELRRVSGTVAEHDRLLKTRLLGGRS